MTTDQTLKQQGYRMPAEWERQQAIILCWPHNLGTWPFQLDRVEKTCVSLILEIAESQEVWLTVNDDHELQGVLDAIKGTRINRQNLKILKIPTHDIWVRDFGPIFVVRERLSTRERLITHWRFNGWGDKYEEEFLGDTHFPEVLAGAQREKIRDLDFILEGGSIDVNGKGLLITSTNCLLNNNRNSQLTKHDIEKTLRENLGAEKIIWVDGEITGDDTDGHIDDAVRFVSEDKLVCISEDNSQDTNYNAIKHLNEQLELITDIEGRPLNLVRLPMPDPVYCSGKRLPASYANFLITNDKVLVPNYRCKKDAVAIDIVQELFKNRKVVGIDCTDLVYGFGAIHCISQQVPASTTHS
ncbi:MAG: agmatine deiminase family protein [Deltaproteobacteria bacterium]|nr:agmatine deiminase family protein [Deltaproteobacteria bacterium]